MEIVGRLLPPDEAAILPAPATLRPRHILWRFGTAGCRENCLPRNLPRGAGFVS